MSTLAEQNILGRNVDSPSENDVLLLIYHIECVRQDAYSKLQSLTIPSYRTWLNLTKATMLSILVANCVCPADVEYITLNDFKQIRNIEPLLNEEILKCLEPQVQNIVKHYYVLANMKTSNMLIISESQKNSMDLILQWRSLMSVPLNNPYIFGAMGKTKAIQINKTFHKYARDCGAEKPNLLRSNNMQYIKIICSLLYTSANEDVYKVVCEYEEYHRLLFVGLISITILDAIGFYENEGVKMVKNFRLKLQAKYNKPRGRKRKHSSDGIFVYINDSKYKKNL